MANIVERVGSKAGTNVRVYESSAGPLHKTKLVCTATPVVLTDKSGVAIYGGVKLYDFPEGLLCTMGAVINGSVTGVSVLATFDGDVALGTATANDTTANTLTTTEANILASTALTTAASKVAVCDAVSAPALFTATGGSWVDGTSTACDLYLNFVIDEDNANITHTGSFTGTVEVVWMILGDK